MEKGKSYLPIIQAIEAAYIKAEQGNTTQEIWVSEKMEKRAKEVAELLGIKVNFKVSKEQTKR